MRVAIIHYWLLHMRGGEKVLESLCKLFSQADIFTHVYDENGVSATIRRHTVRTTGISKLPAARKLYCSYLPLMPFALESLDLSGYDLVISSEAGPAKGVIAPPDAPHICYCHSPMRYIWDQYHVYKSGAGRLAKLTMPLLAPGLRQWDVTSAARVDQFVANSQHVQKRIAKYWRRDAQVVYPPVAVENFSPAPLSEREEFYLWAGELVGYKRPDIMIDAFNRTGKRLVVLGGPEKARKALAAKAKDNITFLGKVSFTELKSHMARCKALIFPGEEDFGIVPVEVMASGRPVIAYGRGGATETVHDGETGLLFEDQSVEGLLDAVERFERSGLADADPYAIAAHTDRFSEQNFLAGMTEVFTSYGVRPQMSLDQIREAAQ
ncbi:glycosyltransferase [Pelagibacterium sp.]|uniref:glycosyltransferase n=1 Tax=Pelagibacterium sp. TaxID=1967288 RepID=UPI003C7A7E3F